MGMVRRNFRRLDKEDFLLIYKTYIRPHMEYCVQAWSPYLKKDIECLEKVQRSATKMVHGLRHLSYEQRLRHLELTSAGRACEQSGNESRAGRKSSDRKWSGDWVSMRGKLR